MPTRIGDLIDKAEASEANANDKADAAVAANQEATDARAVAVEDKKPLAVALAKKGEITKALPDGRFKTYSPSTTSPDGYRTEISGGVDTVVEDDEPAPDAGGNPAPPAPAPGPAPAPPDVPADNAGPAPADDASNPPAPADGGDGTINPPVFR